MGNTLKQETVRILDDFVNTANTFITIAKRVANGESEAEVCAKYRVDRSKFRRLVRTNWYMTEEGTYNSENIKYNSSTYFSWKDKFLDDLLGRYSMDLHENFDENYETAISELDERTRYVVDNYYRKGMTLDELGEEMKLSKERVRQICTKGINQLRHPVTLDIFTKGKSAVGL